MRYKAYTDGACRNAKDRRYPMGWGVLITSHEDAVTVLEDFGTTESLGTSNIAEWTAFSIALGHCLEIAEKDNLALFDFYLDSKLVVEQFNGDWAINQETLLELYSISHRIKRKLGDSFGSVSWISREFNQRADALSRKGLLEFNKVMEKHEAALEKLSQGDLTIGDIAEARKSAQYFFDSGEDEKATLILGKVKEVLNKKL